MARRRVWSVVLVMLAALAAAPRASADPITDFVNPPHDNATLYPTPLPDPWFVPPVGYESSPPGTVLNRRAVTVAPLLTAVNSTQLLVRSTNSKGAPVPIVTTVIVPSAPWTGPGQRPVVAYNTAIDSLGLTCVPSWTLPRGSEIEILGIQAMLAKNYAVVVTDYQGPQQAYAAGRLAGHAVLDALRAAVGSARLGLDPRAPIVGYGYSGGAIAAGWTAELAPMYAPELNLVGMAMGGTPADYRLLFASMDGTNAASAVFLAAVLGVGREYPELFALMNDNARRLGMVARDWCLGMLAPAGVVAPIPVQALADVPDVVDTPVAQHVLDDLRLGGQAPRTPVLLYHGAQEVWIPRVGVETLRDEWCAHGATVQLAEYPGEHVTVGVFGIPAAFAWLDDRLAGRPMPPSCG